MKHRPMSDAPKDGTRIEIRDGPGRADGREWIPGWWDAKRGYWTDGGWDACGDPAVLDPLEWRPLRRCSPEKPG